MWQPLLHFGIALLQLSLPPNNTNTIVPPGGNPGILRSGENCGTGGKGLSTACYYTGLFSMSPDAACQESWGPNFRSVMWPNNHICSAASKSYCCVSSEHLQNESPPQPIGDKNSRQLTMLKPRHPPPSYGSNCGPNGNGQTTACYWKGTFGSTPDEACKETWGSDFRSIGKGDMCNDPYRSYCCVK